MKLIPDDPMIRDIERRGICFRYITTPKCPICGSTCEQVYIGMDGVVGCDECVTVRDAEYLLEDEY